MDNEDKDAISKLRSRWIEDSVKADKADHHMVVCSSERLKGGISSAIHRVTLQSGEEKKVLVVRQFDQIDWLQQEPDLALHEAECLRLAARVKLPTPELIAYDEDGTRSGMPAVLMTDLRGKVVLEPMDMSAWLAGLAEALAKIHGVEAADFPWTYFAYNDVTQLDTPDWSSVPEVWDRAIRYVRDEPIPAYHPCFIHRDYHPANVLWHQGQVSGIVDWVNACRGPAGVDVGHCRLNLALLYSVETADEFLDSYIQHADTHFIYEPYWDLRSLMDILFGPPTVYKGWIELGMEGLTDELMVKRLDRYVKSLLDRI